MAAATVVAAGLIACGGASSVAKKDTSGGTELATITAQNTSFSTSSITVPAAAATIVSFRNNDTVAHTFTVYDGEDFSSEIVADSGHVLPGETTDVTVLFGRPGKHVFQCQIYPQLMRGYILVQ